MINIPETLEQIIRLHSTRNLREAEILCRKILEEAPENPDANHFLGVIAYEVGNFAVARTLVQKAIDLAPQTSACYLNMGNIVQQEGRVEESVQWYEKAILHEVNNKKAYNNLGVALTKLNRLHEAVQQLKTAINLDPLYCDAHNNISETYRYLGEFEKALAAGNRALSILPDYAPARWNRSILLLLTGDFEQGWDEYEWRWKRPQSPKREIISGKAWKGEPLAGKTIFIYEEQGMGDTLQFVRYLPLLRELGARVIFEIVPPMMRLIDASGGFDRLWIGISGKDTRNIDRFDYHLSVMSLPRVFKTRLNTIPDATPYLSVDRNLVSIWKRRIKSKGGFKIGIVWAGHPSHQEDHKRSLRLSLFLNLKSIPGVKLYSLQKDKYEKWTDTDPDDVFEQDFGPEISDFADTAAIIENLDLVISVDTAVVHLAGALSKNTWVLLPYSPDWRWMADRQDSPWYPSMRLFRQLSPDNWGPVFKAVRKKLERIVDVG